MDIHAFLALPHRFRWGGVGGDDCMTFAASWAFEKTGIDPAADLRGTYRTKDEAHTIVASFGGELRFMEVHLSATGARRVEVVETGDIGLVHMLTAGETPTEAVMAPVGAIRFGPLWASIGPSGVRACRVEHVAAWRLPG